MITKTQQYLLSKLPNKLMKHIVVDIESGCWLWQVNFNINGYGRVSVNKDKRRYRVMAHKFIYTLLHGEYEEALKLDHIYCKHRNCCNPTHLSPVTQKVNVHRGSSVLFSKDIKFKPPIQDNTYLEDLLTYN